MILFRAISLAVAELPPNPEMLEFRTLGLENFKRDALFREKSRGPRFEGRLAEGHACFGFVTPKGEAISYLWLSGPDFAVPIVPFELGLLGQIPSGSAYVWDCRTASPFRNRGLFRAGLLRLRTLCGVRGIASVFITAQDNNASSQRAVANAGFTKAATIAVYRIFGKIYFVSNRGAFSLRRRSGIVSFTAP